MVDLDEAFRAVNRADFVPAESRGRADIDAPLSIGFGQTISQPTTVELMLGWLEVEPGDKVLDVGSGSGWTTALLSHLTGLTGQVYAVERIPELVEFGKRNCQEAGIANAQFFVAGDTYGLPKQGPFDKILVSAAASTLPEELLDQLKVAGKLVIPIKGDVLEITKTSKDEYETIMHAGFIFVPLVAPGEP